MAVAYSDVMLFVHTKGRTPNGMRNQNKRRNLILKQKRPWLSNFDGFDII
jgi:hypothetical protein